MDSWISKYARPSPRKKKAFKILVVAMLIFWIPVFVFTLYKGVVEPLMVLSGKVETVGIRVRGHAALETPRYVRQEYLYFAQGRLWYYQGSRLHWLQSSKPILKIWYNKYLPRIAFIPERYFAERFSFFAVVYGCPLLFFAYVHFIKKETVGTYLARRIREEVG